MSVELISTTQQLPDVGTDISGFLTNITPGVLAIGFFFAIIVLILAMIFHMVDWDIEHMISRGYKK